MTNIQTKVSPISSSSKTVNRYRFSNYFCYSDDESTTATEDEEDIRARELRKQEVWLKHSTRSSDTDTGSETEVKISQDSVDNVIEEPLVLPESVSVQTPNSMSSQETNMNNSHAVIDEDIIGAKDIQNSSNTETLKTDMSIVNTDEQVGHTSQSEACGSVIQILDSSFDLISNNTVNNVDTPGTSLVTSDDFTVKDNLNKSSNIEECISEYESLVEESALSKLNEIRETLSELPNENRDSLVSEFNEIGSNELNEKFTSINNETNKINFSNDKSISEIISVNTELSDNVTFGLDVSNLETSNILNTELQTAFAGIMLPDAIPISQINYDNTMLLNTEENGSSKDKLPDRSD